MEVAMRYFVSECDNQHLIFNYENLVEIARDNFPFFGPKHRVLELYKSNHISSEAFDIIFHHKVFWRISLEETSMYSVKYAGQMF